jgi:hypothetical protein
MPTWVVHPILIAIDSLEWLTARAASLAALLAAVAVSHAAWMVVPPYAAHYRLQDRAAVILRTHASHSEAPGDTPELRSALMHAVRGQGLEAHIADGDFEIESTVSMVRMSCLYQVNVEILPGMRHMFHFRLRVEEPVLPKPQTIFL